MTTVQRRAKASRTQRRDVVKAKLGDAVAEALSSGESYTELSVERLVAVAGVSRSTFYVYFEDKGDLLTALARDVVEGINAAATAWWDLGPDVSRDALHHAMSRVAAAYVPHRSVMAAVASTSSHDSRVHEQFSAAVARSVDATAEHIRRGQRGGFVRAGIDPKRTAGWLTWMAERGLAQLVAPATEGERERLVANLTQVVWHTLYVASDPTPHARAPA